jgi:uncharacterized membrane protein YkoI
MPLRPGTGSVAVIAAAGALAFAFSAHAQQGYAPRPGQPPASGQCLSSAAAIEIVARSEAMTAERALQGARDAYPRMEILRARLCRAENVYVYVVTALGARGRVTRIIMDASSGRVIRTQ